MTSRQLEPWALIAFLDFDRSSLGVMGADLILGSNRSLAGHLELGVLTSFWALTNSWSLGVVYTMALELRGFFNFLLISRNMHSLIIVCY